MSQHTITAEIKVQFRLNDMPEDEHETAYPKVEITYSFGRGHPGCMYMANGDPGYPAEPDEVDLISAKLIDGDGLAPEPWQVKEWAEDWLQDEGYQEACNAAYQDNEPDPDYQRDLMLEDREREAMYDDGKDDF